MTGAARKPLDSEIETFGLTHVGKVRKNNEDQFLMATIHKRVNVVATSLTDQQRLPFGDKRLAYIVMVADGVGGLASGEEASATAVEATLQYVTETMDCYYRADSSSEQFIEELQAAALRAHEAVLAKKTGEGRTQRMATTLTLYMGVWPNSYILQVGDSRCYTWKAGTLTQISRDQTMAQDLVDQGVLSSTAARRTPLANILSSALGGDTAMPVVTHIPADWGNVFLFCSDGLTKHVTDAQIAARLAAMTSAQQACEALLQDALDGGGTDNITIIIGRTIPNAG